MKTKTLVFLLTSCLLPSFSFRNLNPAIKLKGTWQLVSGTTVTKGKSVTTDYRKNERMIKIINDTHFAFLKHSLYTKKDSSNHFDAGGGSYSLKGNQYTEHLEYYGGDKNWEDKTFNFTVSLKNDTLIQKGVEKLEKENIDRVIIEKYIRLK